jgi:hypothetical protein
MVATPPANILGAVNSVAIQYGVPTGIWEAVAYTESAYDPKAVGDNGTSFGLFQLHKGGQADAALSQGYTTQQLLDPNVNAKFAMPAMGQAWSRLSASFNANSSSWWQQFASLSGHPGGSTNSAITDQEAAQLQANYAFNGSASGGYQIDPCLNCGAIGSLEYTQCHAALAAKIGTPPPCAQSAISSNQQVVQDQTGLPIVDINTALANIGSLITNITNIQQSLPGALIRIGLFLVALALIVGGGFLVVNSDA